MPYTYLKRSAELALYPADDRWHAHSPGDYICGKVTRFEKLVSPEATLVVAIRAKSTAYTTGSGQATTRHSSEFTFFTNNQYNPQQIVHEGPMHVEQGPSNGLNWEFCIQLPKTTGLSWPAHKWKYMKASYLPITPEEIAEHALPPSFDTDTTTTDYYLEAILEYKAHGKTKRVTSRVPIYVRAESLVGPITEFNIKDKRFRLDARHYNLMPGVSRDQLSFKQKTKALFGTSSVPSLRLQVDFSMPRVLQLGHPGCIPLKLQIRKEAAGTTEALNDIRHKVTITSVRIICKELYEAMASQYDTDYNWRSRDLGLETVFNALTAPLEVETYPGAPELNLGAKLNLRLQTGGLYKGSTPLPMIHQRLTPSFTTYNIKVKNEFKYRVALEIGGHKEEFEDQVEVTLLPEPTYVSANTVSQSSHIVEDAPSTELPPSFADVIEEDERAGRITGAEAGISAG